MNAKRTTTVKHCKTPQFSSRKPAMGPSRLARHSGQNSSPDNDMRFTEKSRKTVNDRGTSCPTVKPKNDEGCLKFLRELLLWSGAASPQDLGPQTSQDQNRARQKCKRRGWATYDGGNVGYWRITDAGRDALRWLSL